MLDWGGGLSFRGEGRAFRTGGLPREGGATDTKTGTHKLDGGGDNGYDAPVGRQGHTQLDEQPGSQRLGSPEGCDCERGREGWEARF